MITQEVRDKIIWMRSLLKQNAPQVYQRFVAKKRAKAKFDNITNKE